MISNGEISDLNGMLPAMKMSEPYSPAPRANASVNPVASAGKSVGRITRTKVCMRDAPSVSAASSASRDTSASTGSTVRTTNGSLMKVSATTIPAGW